MGETRRKRAFGQIRRCGFGFRWNLSAGPRVQRRWCRGLCVPEWCDGACVRITWRIQVERYPTPGSRRTARTMISAFQCRCARTLLRWSISKLSNAASVSESAIDDFELERGEPSAITADAIRRAFEGVGVVFLPQDDVQLRSDAPGDEVNTAALTTNTQNWCSPSSYRSPR